MIVVILAALLFVLTNALHDASSVVATFISSRAGNPVQAISLAAIFSFIGALAGGNAVADTVSSIAAITADQVLLNVLLAAMIGAVIWNLVTWYFGVPSSSTHALIGGLVGAVWMAQGSEYVLWGFNELIAPGHELVGVSKVLLFLLISPLLGFAAAFVLQTITNILLRNAKSTLNKWIERLQWLITALLAFSNGANDTQKIVGIITLALASVSNLSGQVPLVGIKVLVGAITFAGTLLGGWPVIKTIGRDIYTIRPIHGLNSQLSAGASVLLSTLLGAPVSTTHVVVGSVAGVGAADEFRMVNWNIGREIITAWCITIPAAALVAAITYYILW
ncbi:MAG TPA: inorganic phosphate transporter [Desulfitobacteriaceae bacterium]|nr:inorganic phosphate transporter [Desulfitobacteriaceae bacterium]